MMDVGCNINQDKRSMNFRFDCLLKTESGQLWWCAITIKQQMAIQKIHAHNMFDNYIRIMFNISDSL